jgi:Flp pilus assembly pilin Flp
MNKGQALVEYAFILALVIIVVIVSITLFGQELVDFYQNILDQF